MSKRKRVWRKGAPKEWGLNEWTARHTAVVAHHVDRSEPSRALCISHHAPLICSSHGFKNCAIPSADCGGIAPHPSTLVKMHKCINPAPTSSEILDLRSPDSMPSLPSWEVEILGKGTGVDVVLRGFDLLLCDAGYNHTANLLNAPQANLLNRLAYQAKCTSTQEMAAKFVRGSQSVDA